MQSRIYVIYTKFVWLVSTCIKHLASVHFLNKFELQYLMDMIFLNYYAESIAEQKTNMFPKLIL